MTSGLPPTPTLERLGTISDDSQKLGEFLHWLKDEGWQLCRWQEEIEDEEICVDPFHYRRTQAEVAVEGLIELDAELHGRKPPQTDRSWRPNPDCTACQGSGLIRRTRRGWNYDGRTVEQVLAAYFQIDLEAAEQERRALLQHLREQHEDAAASG